MAHLCINPATTMPTDFPTDVRACFERLRAIGYRGYYSLELFNDDVWAQDPFAVARRAYQNVIEYLGPGEEY